VTIVTLLVLIVVSLFLSYFLCILSDGVSTLAVDWLEDVSLGLKWLILCSVDCETVTCLLSYVLRELSASHQLVWPSR